MLETKGEFRAVNVKNGMYIIEVKNCINTLDGKIISEYPIAYYQVLAGGENGAFDQVANGAGEFLGESLEEV